jgi:hypothetical protein
VTEIGYGSENLWIERGIENETAIERGMFIADNNLISKVFFFSWSGFTGDIWGVLVATILDEDSNGMAGVFSADRGKELYCIVWKNSASGCLD